MPRTEIHFFEDERGRAPARDWLQGLRFTDPRALRKCHARLRMLQDLGFEIRRPYADYLRDGIYEIRIRVRREQFRILYFFHGRNEIVLVHAFGKQQRIPDIEVERALRSRRAHEADPERHTSPERWTDA